MKPIVLETLKEVADRHGGILQPYDVLEAAKPESSPLHSYFEWNDSEAAHQHRLRQARSLISIAVEIIPQSKDKTRIWISLKNDQHLGGGYRSMQVVLSDKELRAQLIADAFADMEIFKSKYERLKELAGVIKEFDKIKSKHKSES